MDASEIPDHSNAFRVAKLLGVDGRDLIEALTTKTIFAQGDSVVSNSEKIEFFFSNVLPPIHPLPPSVARRSPDCPKTKRSTCGTPSPRAFTAVCLSGLSTS